MMERTDQKENWKASHWKKPLIYWQKKTPTQGHTKKTGKDALTNHSIEKPGWGEKEKVTKGLLHKGVGSGKGPPVKSGQGDAGPQVKKKESGGGRRHFLRQKGKSNIRVARHAVGGGGGSGSRRLQKGGGTNLLGSPRRKSVKRHGKGAPQTNTERGRGAEGRRQTRGENKTAANDTECVNKIERKKCKGHLKRSVNRKKEKIHVSYRGGGGRKGARRSGWGVLDVERPPGLVVGLKWGEKKKLYNPPMATHAQDPREQQGDRPSGKTTRKKSFCLWELLLKGVMKGQGNQPRLFT